MLVGVGGRRGSAGYPQLGEDVLEMPPDGVLADGQGSGYLAVRLARRDVTEDLELARRQSAFSIGFWSFTR